MVEEEDIRRMSLALPDVEEHPYERMPSFRVNKKLFARIRERPYALFIVRPSIEDKQRLIAVAPDKFPHYQGYPGVLVHMEAIDQEELRELLTLAWSLKALAKTRAKLNLPKPETDEGT